MLGKLIKHEFKSTSKLVLPLYIVLVILTILGRIVAQSVMSSNNLNDSAGLMVFNISSVMVYVLGLFAVSITTYIYFVIRFYKNLFSDEGYLMHTLPVTSWQLLSSKLLVAFIWSLVEILLICLSIFCIFANQEVFDIVKNFVNSYGGLNGITQTYFGMNFGNTLILIIILVILSALSGLLLPYASICIGQLWQKHKVAGSFLSFIGITLILQIIGTVYTGLSTSGSPIIEETVFFAANYRMSITSSIISSILFFLVSGFLMDKKVNLD